MSRAQRISGTWTLVAVWAGIMSSAAWADTPTADLVKMAQDAKQQFAPLPAEQVGTLRHRVLAAAQRLEGLISNGTAENTAAWKSFLRFDDMLAELQKPEKPNLKTLSNVVSRYFRNEPGLELEPFLELRTALFDYMWAVSLASVSNLADAYQSKLDQLIEWLPAYAEHPTVPQGQQIGQVLDWLERAGQASELVAAIREQHWHPNLYAEISETLAAAGVADQVTESTEVRDYILGTSLRGTATLHGQTDLRMVDDADTAALQLHLTGKILSDNVGRNRGVTIYSRGTTSVDATKQILVDPQGIRSSCADAHCCTDSSIDCIAAKSCLVERIAWKRAGRSQGKVEQIASRHAEQRVAEQMDGQAEELLDKAREQYQDKFRQPLLRRGEFPQDFRFQTQNGRLKVVWRQANQTQLAAPTAPPQLDGTHDLAVRLHESFVTNFSRALLGGVTLTDEKLVQILQDSTGEVPDELKISSDKEPWSITFSATQPVSAVFTEDTIRFAIRGERFTFGDQKVSDTLEMAAVYTLQKTPQGAHLTRQGDVSVEYIDAKKPLSAKQITIRTVMRNKFESLFGPEFNTKGVKLPGRWEKAGALHLEQLQSQNGWLALAWLAQAGGAEGDVSVAMNSAE